MTNNLLGVLFEQTGQICIDLCRVILKKGLRIWIKVVNQFHGEICSHGMKNWYPHINKQKSTLHYNLIIPNLHRMITLMINFLPSAKKVILPLMSAGKFPVSNLQTNISNTRQCSIFLGLTTNKHYVRSSFAFSLSRASAFRFLHSPTILFINAI